MYHSDEAIQVFSNFTGPPNMVNQPQPASQQIEPTPPPAGSSLINQMGRGRGNNALRNALRAQQSVRQRTNTGKL